MYNLPFVVSHLLGLGSFFEHVIRCEFNIPFRRHMFPDILNQWNIIKNHDALLNKKNGLDGFCGL
jgi:hypothetical protein